MLCNLVALVLTLAQPADLWPPRPDFQNKIDYEAWVQDRIRGHNDPAENAADLYRQIFPRIDNLEAPCPDGLLFGGLRGSFSPPRPWNPAEHPEWEASYQRTRETLETFRAAVARPFYQFPRQENSDDLPWLRGLLPSRVMPHIPPFHGCILGLADAAWRAPGGQVDVAAFFDTCQTRLRAARQLEREPMIISMIAALDARYTVYEDLRYALHHNILTAAQRRQALELLEREDAPLPPFAHYLATECAAPLDLLQAMTQRGNDGQPEINHQRYAELAERAMPISPFAERPEPPTTGEISGLDHRQTARRLLEHYVKLAELIERGYPRATREVVEMFEELAGRDDPFLRRFMPSVAQAHVLRTCCLAERNGARLVLALHLYHDEHGTWPTDLGQLPAERFRDFLADPCSGRPLVYRLSASGPLLYTVGLNGRDDGGEANLGWKAYWTEPPPGDGVFWPIPVQPLPEDQPTTQPAPQPRSE
jgi:hypothetical protein